MKRPFPHIIQPYHRQPGWFQKRPFTPQIDKPTPLRNNRSSLSPDCGFVMPKQISERPFRLPTHVQQPAI
ncbi:MAG: hypothetical protein R6X32_10410 [Chloroflexota bacterium]